MVSVIMTISKTRAFVIFCLLICSCDSILCTKAEEDGQTLLEDFLICRSCGADAAISNFIFSKLSEKNLVANNETVFGKRDVLVQILENPLGNRFEVVSLKRASCARISTWKTSFSWFSGFAWKLCLCPKCASHLGWMFEPVETATKNQIFPSEKGFYLLIVDSVIAENLSPTFLGILHQKPSDYNGESIHHLPGVDPIATKMVDPNRKINRLTEKDIEFLDECEEEFKDRFTLDDEEFMRHCRKEVPPPPIVDPWISRNDYQDGDRGGRGGWGGRGGYRDHFRGRRFYNQRGHSGRHFRNRPYNRRNDRGSDHMERNYH